MTENQDVSQNDAVLAENAILVLWRIERMAMAPIIGEQARSAVIDQELLIRFGRAHHALLGFCDVTEKGCIIEIEQFLLLLTCSRFEQDDWGSPPTATTQTRLLDWLEQSSPRLDFMKPWAESLRELNSLAPIESHLVTWAGRGARYDSPTPEATMAAVL